MKTGLIALIMIGLLISIIPINFVKAGSTTLPSASVHNTRISTSFSYPDTLYWEDDISFPVTLSVIFENQSITYVSVWKTKVRLVEITANPMPMEPDTLYSYAIGGNQTMDPFFNPLYMVENPTESKFVARLDFEITNFSWVSVLQSSVEAKIFFEISLTLVGTDGSRYSITIYTMSGQQPTVTIQSRTGAHPTSDHAFPWGSVALIVFITAICLSAIVIISKRRKAQKNAPSSTDAREAGP
jgi:hypothetical protein